MPYPSTIGGGLMGYPSTVDSGGVVPEYLGPDVAAMNGAQNQTISQNTVFLYEVELQAPCIVTGFRYRAGNAATGHVNGAIYTAAGNIVAGSDTGQIANTSTTTNVSFTYPNPISLSPGVYFVAFASDSTTDTFIALSSQTGGQLLSRARQATNALAAGAMPLTTGTLVTSGTKMPAYSFPLSGGI